MPAMVPRKASRNCPVAPEDVVPVPADEVPANRPTRGSWPAAGSSVPSSPGLADRAACSSANVMGT